MSEPLPELPRQYEIIKQTWLTKRPSHSARTTVTFATVALMAGSSIYFLDLDGAERWMAATGEQVFQKHEWWRLWTTLFAHADLGHLASNTLLFYILGYFLSGYFGWRLFPVGALIWGGLVNLAVLPTYDSGITLLGASGIVYWMGGAWLVLYALLSRQKNRKHRILRTLGVGVLIFMPAGVFDSHVSHRTHLTGFVLGCAVGFWHYYFYREKFIAAEVREVIVEDVDQVESEMVTQDTIT